MLEKGILPTFEALLKLEEKGIIVAGGLPVGERTFTFVLKATSNEEADQILRKIPAWGVLNWKVMPLQSFKARSKMEKAVLADLKENR